MKRTIWVSLASIAVAAGLLGPTASSADVTPQVRQEFDCPDVRAESDIPPTPKNWGVPCVSRDRFTVTPNMHLCVAVRGSLGYHIVFRAFNVANNAWAGGKSAPLIVGEPRDCFYQNKTTRNVVVEFRAWRNEQFPFVDVAATGYVQRASS